MDSRSRPRRWRPAVITDTQPPTAQLLDWAWPLLRESHRFKVVYGGRGTGKTKQIGGALILLSVERPIRVACVRQTQKSIRESCKYVLEEWIDELGLGWAFTIQRDSISNIFGSYFFFSGMDTVTAETMKGWQSVDICWVEEGHTVKARPLELLLPTIRKIGSEVWVSFNPRYRHDPIYQRFVANPDPRAWVKKVGYEDNPFFGEVLEGERLECLRREPERYAHIWLGEPDDEGAERQVLPYMMLAKCAAAADSGVAAGVGGRLHAGLDVADSGTDRNALVIRRGPLVEDVQQWTAGTLGVTARRADAICRERGVQTLYYDAGGVGAGIRSHFADMGPRPYNVHPVNFGAAVAGGDTLYAHRQTNAEFFARRNAQLGWALRLRAQATQRLDDGDDIDPERCLFFSPHIASREAYLAQLTQPQWEEQISGRIAIDKTPDDAPSPDMYDATALAFAHDSRRGLRARR